MSEGTNKVTLLGNLGADPELRYTGNSTPVLNLRLATEETWFDKEKQERETRTEWHSVVIFGARAEGLSKFLAKGRQVYVEGSLRTSSWEKDGAKHYKTDVVASNIIPCGPSDKGEGRAPSAPAPAAKGKPAARTGGGKPKAPADDLPY